MKRVRSEQRTALHLESFSRNLYPTPYYSSHPGATRIDLHHVAVGTVGVIAGLFKGLASWLPDASPLVRKRLKVAWEGEW